MFRSVCSILRFNSFELHVRFFCAASKQPTSAASIRPASTMAQASPFTSTVVSAMRHLYPESLAELSFDNTGLLLEAPLKHDGPKKSNSVLLTIDLTRAVAQEAIDNNHSVVVAYHPIIFRGLKAITLEDTQQTTLLQLASHGISVYSPHTAVDTVPNGMADWLCDIVTGRVKPGPEGQVFTAESDAPTSSSETDVTTSEDETGKSELPKKTANDNVSSNYANTTGSSSVETTPKGRPAQRPRIGHRTYSKPSYPSQRTSSPIQTADNATFYPSNIAHKRSVIIPRSAGVIDAANASHQQTIHRTSSSETSPPYNTTNTGAGRLITFDEPQPLATLITRIANATGLPKGFPVAIPQYRPLETLNIRTVGVCPGSGSSVIRECATPPDLVFMGEMSHHDALAVIERGGCVITLFHSNSERGYLERVMRRKLEDEVKRRWRDARQNHHQQQQTQSQSEEHGGDGGSSSSNSQAVKDIFADERVRVVVSERDRDPFGIVVLQESQVEGQNL